MNDAASSWSTYRLAEFVAAVSTAADVDGALDAAVDHVAEALEAGAVAVVRGGAIARSVGWPADELPAVSAPLGDGGDAALLVARADPLAPAEASLLQAMARTLGLALVNHAMVAELRVRQQLLEGLSGIQRSIARRAPLDEVLQAIVGLAHAQFRDEQAALLLRDLDDPETLVTVASHGYPPELLDRLVRRRIGVGVGGAAVAEGRLIAVDDYASSPYAVADWVDADLRRAMAAPVFEGGEAIGSLIVTAFGPSRGYSTTEQAVLSTIAEHAGLALADAKTAQEMVHQALHDSLTGLPNRVLFGDRLGHALERAERGTGAVAVLFVDLDRFKTVNDSLGHAAGDELLRQVAGRIGGCLRAADTAGRLGGDEFAILLEDVTAPDEAGEVAQRVIEAVAAPIALEGREVFVGASVGIATGRRGDELLRHADVAMYRAKTAGRGRYAHYHESMDAEALDRLDLEASLRRALDRNELGVHYQPIFALGSGELHGVEALVRWRDPQRGMVAPLAFVPLAEETGLIAEIGRRVLRAACMQASAWLRAGARRDLRLAVNLSGRQLEDPGFAETVREALAESGIAPAALLLEITETVLMADTEAMLERLAAVRELGVRLAVDDFGTGYSSLRCLNRFPVDVLKMAQPFVDRIDEDVEHRALARSIVDLGSNLGLQVIAEGIERPEQLAELRRLGCELGQGFHFAVPGPAAEVEPLVLRGRVPASG